MSEREAVWACAVGAMQPEPGSWTEAFMDTMPQEYALMLSRGGPALEYAIKRYNTARTNILSPARRHGGEPTPFLMRETCREAWARFLEEAERREAVEFGLGFDQSAAWDHEFRADMPNKLLRPATVYDIARLAGRLMVALKGEKATKINSSPEEVYDVELGGDPSRLLPSEMIHLGQPTELMLLNRINEQRALQYKLRGESEAKRGPLIIAIDESGSMGGKAFKRGVWAKAAAVALTRIAWEDGRDVHWIHWSTSVCSTEMPKPDEKSLLYAVRHFYGGGNDCAKALERASTHVRWLDEGGKPGADVVLITDGVEQWTKSHEEAIDSIHDLGARLWTIGIEVDTELDASAPIVSRAAAYTAIGGRGLEEADVGGVKGAVL